MMASNDVLYVLRYALALIMMHSSKGPVQTDAMRAWLTRMIFATLKTVVGMTASYAFYHRLHRGF